MVLPRGGAYRIDPSKSYRIAPDFHPIRPIDDFIGINFNPKAIVIDNLRNYRNTKRLIDNRVISKTATMARGLADISSEGEFVEHLRTMIYDVESGISLEETLGGRDGFNAVVEQAKARLWEEQHPYQFLIDFYDPD